MRLILSKSFGIEAFRMMDRLITSMRNFARDSVALGWGIGMLFNNVRDIRDAAACALDEIEVGMV
jgi:hypothetical protein